MELIYMDFYFLSIILILPWTNTNNGKEKALTKLTKAQRKTNDLLQG